MQKQAHSFIAGLGIIVSLGTAGCVAVPGEAEADYDTQTAAETIATTWLPKRGTGEGVIPFDGTGNYYAYRANAGLYVDALTFRYHSPSDGETFRVGGFGGTDTGWLTCYDGDVAVGYDTSSGTLLDRFVLVCKGAGGELYGWSSGGDGGTANLDLCPSGTKLTDLRIFTNRAYPGYISGIQGGCQ